MITKKVEPKKTEMPFGNTQKPIKTEAQIKALVYYGAGKKSWKTNQNPS